MTQCKLASLKVFTCDYSGALEAYTDVCSSILYKCSKPSNSSKTLSYNRPIGFYSKLLVESDITKLLLLLFLKPTKMKFEYSNTLEVYSYFQTLSNSNISYLPVACMDKDLFILLQSFVMAYQSNDANILYELQIELWPLLNSIQKYVINLITEKLLHSSYTDDLLSE